MRCGRLIIILALLTIFAAELCCINIAEAKDWLAVMEEGTRAMSAGRYGEAMEAYNTALRTATDDGKKAAALSNIGRVYKLLGQYDKALEYTQQALAISRRIGNTTLEASILSGLGDLNRRLGKYEKALEDLQQALAISRKVRQTTIERITLDSLSRVYLELHQYQKALDYEQQVLELSRKTAGDLEVALTLDSLGHIYRSVGMNKKALDHFQQALKLHKKIGDSGSEGSTLGNIGDIYEEFGQYEKALEYQQHALAIFRTIGDSSLETSALSSLGETYRVLGQYEKAIECFQQVLTTYKGGAANSSLTPSSLGKIYAIGEGNALTKIGEIYTSLGQHEKALEYFQKALPVLKRGGDDDVEAAALIFIGSGYLNLGQYEKALDNLQKGQAIQKRIRSIDAGALFFIGNAHFGLGQYEKALENYQQALELNRKREYIKAQNEDLNGIGMALLALGKPDRAETALATAIKSFESVREKVRSEKERTGFQSTIPDLYGSLAAVNVAIGKPQSAFEAIERGRAKTFLDLLGTRETARNRSKEKTSELARTENELSKLREERVQLASAPAGSKTRLVPAVDQMISDTDKRRIELIDQMRRSDPELGSLATVDAPTLKEIQSMLSPGAFMIEYCHVGRHVVSKKNTNELWIFLVHKEGFDFKKVAVTRDDLQGTLDKYAALLADSGSNRGELEATSAKLNGWLIEPIQPSISKIQPKTLILVPWNSMFKVPFASITPQGGPPFGAQQNIVVAPSAGICRYMANKRASGRKNVVALGNPQTALSPLKGAEQEVQEISSLFGKSTLRTGAQATEKLLKAHAAELGHPDVIHLACHGIFNDKAPELSYLALTPDQQNDGKLEMHELFDLDWKGVSLVTLSACSSGKGKLGAGDDLVGMTRGFMFAGTPSVLSSLWDVDDGATRTLMVNFYKNYTSGMTKPESLRNAQIAVMENPKWSHPYYWSAFVLFGDWE